MGPLCAGQWANMIPAILLVLVLIPQPTPVCGEPGSYLTNLYKMLVTSKEKFGKFVKPERQKVKLVERGGDSGSYESYDAAHIRNYLNDRVDNILGEFNMKREASDSQQILPSKMIVNANILENPPIIEDDEQVEANEVVELLENLTENYNEKMFLKDMFDDELDDSATKAPEEMQAGIEEDIFNEDLFEITTGKVAMKLLENITENYDEEVILNTIFEDHMKAKAAKDNLLTDHSNGLVINSVIKTAENPSIETEQTKEEEIKSTPEKWLQRFYKSDIISRKSQEKTNSEKDKIQNSEYTIEYEEYHGNSEEYSDSDQYDDDYHDEYLDHDITPGLPLTDLSIVNIFSTGLNKVRETFSSQNFVKGQDPNAVSLESPVLVEQELDPNKRNTFGNAMREFVDPSVDSEEYGYVTENLIGDSAITFKPLVRERNYHTSTPSNFKENEPFLSFRDEFQFQFHNPKNQIQTMMTKILRQDDDIFRKRSGQEEKEALFTTSPSQSYNDHKIKFGFPNNQDSFKIPESVQKHLVQRLDWEQNSYWGKSHFRN